ncbi:hypothetical protein SAMN02745225_00659 [Ferrithrix thermotolerans DSM 19514]|uniref:Uncharacterized protein n=1 Tax=Ferrithrix thermotolerans DSM 19514 TaxID=1121881 RepID=A0A1M4TMQ6_9ACTN|nr:hypothetical protein [Ferrithrix thermotolerans]SHE45782.1 hypothetical protein SAMN02745225_00659 [Ferrithrix thermotolerans DSM 19514]
MESNQASTASFSLSFNARLISVADGPGGEDLLAVVERISDRCTVLCRLGVGDWQSAYRYLGKTVMISGMPIYADDGRVMRFDGCEILL